MSGPFVLTGWGPRATSRGEGTPVPGRRGRRADGGVPNSLFLPEVDRLDLDYLS